MVAFGDDDFDGVRGGAENLADLGDILDGIEDVDGESAFHEDDERVAAGEGHRVFLREFDEPLIVAGRAYQRRPGRLAERDTKLHARHGLHDGLVEVFDGFDEVRLAEDEIHVGGFFDADGFEVHARLRLRNSS